MEVVVIGLCLLIIFMVIMWIWSKLTLEARNCSNLNTLYKQKPIGFKSIFAMGSPNSCYCLNDYYIKTAYNCCATGQYKNDFVSLCALKDCIRQGVRCLDFEIYSVDNEPVISVSDVNNFRVKGSYNTISFTDALETVSKHAFGGHALCPNPEDPLIIYLRIMSNNKIIYNKMAKTIYNTLERRVLGKKYSYEYRAENGHHLNLGKIPIKALMTGTIASAKVIFIVDKTANWLEKTALDEYINMTSGRGKFMRTMRYSQFKTTSSVEELVSYNKNYMTICLPDLGINPVNPSFNVARKFGCQLVAMAFQNYDTNMEYYDEFFTNNGTAFVLKPANLRSTPNRIPPVNKSIGRDGGIGRTSQHNLNVLGSKPTIHY